MAHPGVHAATNPEGIALIDADSGESMSWAALHASAVHTANMLHEQGLRPGTSVAWIIENRFEFSSLMWASLYSGLRFTPISTRLGADETSYIVHDCGASVVLHSAATQASVAAVGPDVQRIDIDATNLLISDQPLPRYERAEGVSMLYSSGTTGKPKGVVRPAPPEPIEEIPAGDAGMGAMFGLGTGSIYLSTAPLYHSAPITFLVRCGRLGATTVVMRRFDPLGSLETIERHGVTHSQWVPTMFVRMLRLSEDDRTRFDLSSHTFAIHGAGPCTIAIKEQMLEWWGPIVHEYYAGTEGAGTCLISPQEWLEHKGSVGRSVSGPIRIIDDDGNDVPTGSVGQIWWSAGANFSYHNDKDKTLEARTAEGGGTFGDIGYLNDDGYLFLTDRKSFTINAGGINVYPREIEEVLLAHPDVDDVAVFGVPNEEYGEEVKAVVQLRAGLSGTSEIKAELHESCRTELAGFKQPRSIDFDPDLPREPTGKLRKQVIRDRYL